MFYLFKANFTAQTSMPDIIADRMGDNSNFNRDASKSKNMLKDLLYTEEVKTTV